jgi:hypothetical protein
MHYILGGIARSAQHCRTPGARLGRVDGFNQH